MWVAVIVDTGKYLIKNINHRRDLWQWFQRFATIKKMQLVKSGTLSHVFICSIQDKFSNSTTDGATAIDTKMNTMKWHTRCLPTTRTPLMTGTLLYLTLWMIAFLHSDYEVLVSSVSYGWQEVWSLPWLTPLLQIWWHSGIHQSFQPLALLIRLV